MRPTPFGLAFEDLARERFPQIADERDRDRFVLQEPVGRLLRELVPEDAGADGLEAHVRMLHHAHRHWVSGGWVYRIGDATLDRALGGGDAISSSVPHGALYLQLPELRAWGSPSADGAAEPLDGAFVTATQTQGAIAVLGIFGMRDGRPGFSAVAVEGRADPDDPAGDERLIDATREDGSAPFTPALAGGERAGILSVANAGELLLLTCRILARLESLESETAASGPGFERFVAV